MSKFLKGNYEVKGGKPEDGKEKSKEQDKDFSTIFENSAMEKLGGSIAFVMKSNKFVWDEDEDPQ